MSSESELEIVYFFHKKYIVIHIKYIKLVNDYEKKLVATEAYCLSRSPRTSILPYRVTS